MCAVTGHGPGIGPVRALSFHADYKCQHSGKCCSADWDVPVELPVYRSLQAAVEAGSLVVSSASAPLAPFVVEPDLPDDVAAMFERNDHGECVFFERGSRLCIVHRDLGEPALPATCRHFPRVAVRDSRGTFVSLSHFCPTAASLLFRDDMRTAVVTNPPAFPPADYEGLIITPDDLPPLLRPNMLMDLDGYAAWERHMVDRCAVAEDGPESVLATLARDARLLREWRPGPITLTEAVAALPRDRVRAGVAATEDASLETSLALHAEVMRAVPDDLRPALDETGLAEAFDGHVRAHWGGFSVPLTRYVAAKAFASWTAYQGRGVATIVRGLEAALALVRVEASRQCRDAGRPLDADLLTEAIRGADFALNHLAVGEDLAEAWSSVEVSSRS
jgi:Fe-S-cluster containining protein